MESGGSEEESGKKLGSVQPETRTCPVCGTKFFATADGEFCPVCILHGAFGVESGGTGESASVAELATAGSDKGGAGSQLRRFENYEVILDETGKPMELGRGAMGVTYKAFDGSKEMEIEAAFRGAISTANQQKATSLLVRAETTFAEYSRQKTNALAGRGIRLPL